MKWSECLVSEKSRLSELKLGATAAVVGGLSVFASMPSLDPTQTPRNFGATFQALAEEITFASIQQRDVRIDVVSVNKPIMTTLDGKIVQEWSVGINPRGKDTSYFFDVVSPVSSSKNNEIPVASSVSVVVLSGKPLKEVYYFGLLKDAPSGWVETKTGYNLTNQSGTSGNYSYDSLDKSSSSSAVGIRRLESVTSQAFGVIEDSTIGDSVVKGVLR